MLLSIRASSRNCLMCTRGLRKRSNPGLGHQITALEDVAAEIQHNPEGFGDLESDLVNVHKTHKRFELEQQHQRSKIRQFVIKSKYFPAVKLPNFLTHAEKEQIRLLHNRDPEQWSVEVLSESFPANSEVIRNILKANWKPLSINRITSHDVRVFKNWEQFKRGDLDLKLPTELQYHLKRFSPRQLEQVQTSVKISTKPEQQVPVSSEFSSIISLYRKEEKRPEAVKDNLIKTRLPSYVDGEDETFLLDKVDDKKYIRKMDLKEFKPVLDNFGRPSEEMVTSVDHKLASCDKISSMTSKVDGLPSNFSEKFTLSEVEISDEDQKRFEMSTVKDRIHIPRKLLRTGAIYRVEDSYYDDDGKFLYRVPGMIGE